MLSGPPFALMTTCSLLYIPDKMALVFAITLARRVGGLQYMVVGLLRIKLFQGLAESSPQWFQTSNSTRYSLTIYFSLSFMPIKQTETIYIGHI